MSGSPHGVHWRHVTASPWARGSRLRRLVACPASGPTASATTNEADTAATAEQDSGHAGAFLHTPTAYPLTPWRSVRRRRSGSPAPRTALPEARHVPVGGGVISSADLPALMPFCTTSRSAVRPVAHHRQVPSATARHGGARLRVAQRRRPCHGRGPSRPARGLTIQLRSAEAPAARSAPGWRWWYIRSPMWTTFARSSR
mgnify:CR=1 FL=1